jgi:hypothetical protein
MDGISDGYSRISCAAFAIMSLSCRGKLSANSKWIFFTAFAIMSLPFLLQNEFEDSKLMLYRPNFMIDELTQN